MVARFLRGVFNNRSPAPKYTATWDTDIVLKHLERGPDNQDLSLQQLTHKLALILALANADKCLDLAAMDINRQYQHADGVQFVITALTKTRWSGPALDVFYPAFPDSPRLCPVRALK